jgi:hypothetical protein
LAKALLAALKKRFQHLESDEKCRFAAAFHPIFRNLVWLPTEKHEDLKNKMQELIAANLKKRIEEAPLTFRRCHPQQWCRYFCRGGGDYQRYRRCP